MRVAAAVIAITNGLLMKKCRFERAKHTSRAESKRLTRLLFTTPAKGILETLHGEVSANFFTDGGFLFSLVGVAVDGEVFHGSFDFWRRRLDGRARRERRGCIRLGGWSSPVRSLVALGIGDFPLVTAFINA